MDWRIKFVGTVDRNGKLLVGRSKDITSSCPNFRLTDIVITSTRIVNSKMDDLVEIFLRSKNMYLFYSGYLLWVIENCLAHLNNHKSNFGSNVLMDINEISAYFEISGCNNGDVKLAITPLNAIQKTLYLF